MTMVKRFCKATKCRIIVDRMLGRRSNELIISFQGDQDFLAIFRDAPNSYRIYFGSHISENSWEHANLFLKEVVCAIKSFDGGTDMFDNPFHNEKNGTFEY